MPLPARYVRARAKEALLSFVGRGAEEGGVGAVSSVVLCCC